MGFFSLPRSLTPTGTEELSSVTMVGILVVGSVLLLFLILRPNRLGLDEGTGERQDDAQTYEPGTTKGSAHGGQNINHTL